MRGVALLGNYSLFILQDVQQGAVTADESATQVQELSLSLRKSLK